MENVSFEITFAREQQLKGRKLNQAIDDYHNLTPDATKQTKSKADNDENVELNTDLDDGSERHKTVFKIYRAFDGIIYTGKIAAYDPRDELYHIKYEDGDDEWFFRNEVHSYKDKIESNKKKLYSELSNKEKIDLMPNPKPKLKSMSKPTSEPKSEPIKLKKKKDIRRKYCTRA